MICVLFSITVVLVDAFFGSAALTASTLREIARRQSAYSTPRTNCTQMPISFLWPSDDTKLKAHGRAEARADIVNLTNTFLETYSIPLTAVQAVGVQPLACY